MDAEDSRLAVIAAGSTVGNTGSLPATLRVSPGDPLTSQTTPSSSPAAGVEPAAAQPHSHHRPDMAGPLRPIVAAATS